MEIKLLRLSLGMTQEQLAHELGVSFKTVNRWERGKSKPSSLALYRLGELQKKTIAGIAESMKLDANNKNGG